MSRTEKRITLLGQVITPEIVRQVVRAASLVQWGTHLLRWRYFDVRHEGVIYQRNALIPTALWHLLKRVYVDEEWPRGTTQENLDQEARATIQSRETEIYVYGYYRTNPPRLQWGFLNPKTGIAVVYDIEAELIATVFKPAEGALFFTRQLDAVRIDRKEWNV